MPFNTSDVRPALWSSVVAAVAGHLVLLVAVWIAGGADSAPAALRTASRAWLVVHGSGLDAGAADIRLIPLGATLLAIAVVHLVTRGVAVDPPADASVFTGLAATAYALIAIVACLLAGGDGVAPSVLRAALGGLVVGALGAGSALVAVHGAPPWWPGRDDVREGARAAVAGVAVVLGVAAVLVLGLLAWQVQRAGDLWAALQPGAGGGLVLVLATLLSLPTLVLWCASALLGPGFALGTDTSVDLTGSHLGQVPAFPAFAALPPPGEFGGIVFVLALVPVLAGMVVGWRLTRALPEAGLLDQVKAAAIAGAASGLVLGVLVALSGGAIGPGRMADVGPPVMTPLLVAVPVLAVGAALGAVLAHYRGGRVSRPAPDDSAGRPRLGRGQQSSGPDRRDSRP